MSRWDDLPTTFATGVMIFVVTVTIALLLSCRGRVQQRPAQEAGEWMHDGRWCLIGDRGSERIMACFESLARCDWWQKRARRRGRLAGLRSVSDCQVVVGKARWE